METGESTAFAHEDSEGARLAHHLRAGNEGREIIGHTETIAGIDAGAFQSRDPITGVRDSRAARGWIEATLIREGGLVVLLLAVSRFDAINAAFGRAPGDAVLHAAARRIEIGSASGRARGGRDV